MLVVVVFFFQFSVPQRIDIFTVNGASNVKVDDIDSSTVAFNCSATGRPASSITFYDNDNKMLSSRSITVAEANDTTGIITNYHGDNLTLTKCEQTGTYKCEADNQAYESTSTGVKVYVTCKYKIITITFVHPMSKIASSC